MISLLTGKFLEKTPTRLVIDVNGVGYEVHISLHTYSYVQGLEQGTLHTHLKVAEDAFTLYGFSSTAEKDLFLKLLSVSGVGAATARMMLSSLKPAELVQAIGTGQVSCWKASRALAKRPPRELCWN